MPNQRKFELISVEIRFCTMFKKMFTKVGFKIKRINVTSHRLTEYWFLAEKLSEFSL